MLENSLSHLIELRKRIILCLVFYALAFICAYFFARPVLDFLIEPIRRYQETQLFFHRPYEAFLTHLKVAAFTALFLSLPLFFYQAWAFIVPALYVKEKKAALPIALISLVLFLVGASFAYGIVVPFCLRFLLGFQTSTLQPLIGIAPYFSFLTGMMLAFGILFDMPIVIVGLVRFGITTSEQLAKARRMIILLLFIGAAVLTPPDPMSQVLLAAPLILLFEISLRVARIFEPKSSKD